MTDDTGYELSDPKHPTFYDRYCDYADLMRKRQKEDEFERRMTAWEEEERE